MNQIERRICALEQAAMPTAGTLPASVPDDATEAQRLALVAVTGKPVYRFEELPELFV